MRTSWAGLRVAMAVAMVACGAGEGEPTRGAVRAVDVRRVAPQELDARASATGGDHVVMTSGVTAATGKLFVFFPATFVQPTAHSLVAQEAARSGYHALIVAYPNATPIEDSCADDADPGCFEKVRVEKLTGEDASPHVAVSASDAIVPRLVKLLAALDQRFPAEGWGAFLDGEAPRYSAITLAGHSQGGGHAAYLGSLFAVDRLLVFSSPSDHDAAGAPAPWMRRAHATPPARMYALASASESGSATLVSNWDALGLRAFGPPADVETAAPPYGGAHALLTSMAPRAGLAINLHNGTAVDGATPVDDEGAPRLAPVWRFMLTN